ncbi:MULTISPECIES: glycosyl hydrolase family 95 catalytic domain-containing protein [Streptomyces]|uniref:Glycoside hydrolase N-terminal domain-containing protein n=2 Tax=Streptomyces TaxID=1883 RepID=A0ABU4K8P4_9ACTN|nr:glycoside hydrolase N-terminal domain-containing protein [Streptomyces roseolus]MDX2294131.1 glycoside hydrolase N-terminal domain-containing protein [Streptomyces roseolus]
MTEPVHGTWEPEPATRWEDAFLAGNGRHGALVYGDPRDDRVIVTHHTLVRPHHRPGDTDPPRLADRLRALQDALLAGDLTAAETFTDGRPLRWIQPFHPGFQTHVRADTPHGGPDALDTSGARREVDFTTGVVTATARAATAPARTSRVLVSRADDVLVQYVTEPGPRVRVELDHRLSGAPPGLIAAHGVATAHGETVLTLGVRYPDSTLGYTGVTLVVPDSGRTTLTDRGIRVEGARRLLLLTRVRRHDGPYDPAEETAALRALAGEDGPSAAYVRLLDRHTALHRAAYRRVGLDLAADPAERALPGSALLARPAGPALLERLFAAGRYHLLSSSGMLPPRLCGLWTGDWDTAWAGGFTTDANLALQTASAVAADLPEVSEAHRALIRRQFADWRDNARAVFGARGIVAPAHTDGESGHAYHFDREYPLHLWTAAADWLLLPLLEADEAAGRRDPWLTARLLELSDFYEDFLTRTGPDGRLAVVPSYSPENRPDGGSWGAVNATMDLAAARHALTAAADRAPATRAGRLRALADRLPPYRVNADGALAEWAWPGLGDRYDHRHLSHLYPVWPLDAITPYDTPDLARAAARALELRGSENDSAHGHLHQGLIAARLGDAVRAGDALRRVLDGDYFHASLMSAHYPKRDVYNADAAHALPALLVEALVRSTPDRLVLLPAPPPGLCARGRLTGVRTRFGARIDLAWAPGEYRCVLRPDRDATVELRAPGEVRRLALRAGVEQVLAGYAVDRTVQS